MRVFISYGCLVIWLCIMHEVSGQIRKDKDEKIIAELMERFIENQEANLDYTDLQEQLEFYMKNKLNLNEATRAELEKLFFVSEKQVNAILKHRSLFGNFITVFELQTIDVLDELSLYYLSYFVTVDEDLMTDRTRFYEMSIKGKHELIALHENEFEQRAGYDEGLKTAGKNDYAGSPYRHVLRYRFGYGSRLSYGYTAEKDMGEQFFNGAQKNGFDFNSLHFLYRPSRGLIKTVAIGDYQANFGQGLVFGSGIAARKSAFVMSVKRNFQALRPYRSLNENEFLRGAAFTMGNKKWELTSFISHKYISTNFRTANDTTDEPSEEFSSIQISGLHRTASEILNRYNVLQTIYGSHLAWKFSSYQIGFTALQTLYDKPFIKGEKPYQLYNFSGNSLTNLGMDFNFQLRNLNWFGEIGRSDNNGWAINSAMMIPLDERLDLLLLYRNYDKNYQTTYNNPFGENSDGRNEEGIYTGVSVKFSRKWLFNTYFDWYNSPWLRYLTDAPSRGYDYLGELQYNPSKNTQLYIRFRYENKWRNQPNNTIRIDFTTPTTRNLYRLHIQYKISNTWSGKSRAEFSQYHDPITGFEEGALIFQDIQYNTPYKKLTVTSRVAFFSIDNYNARIYATENDVLYQYAVPMFQNSGVRYFLMANMNITKKLEAWIKYSITAYQNAKTISSGLEQINGNSISDLRVQIRYVF